jgi:hypothetical protein
MKVRFHLVFDNPVRMGHVPGYKHPEQVLTIVQGCYKAAAERILQALATRVTHPTP